jgi:hypothetical protein
MTTVVAGTGWIARTAVRIVLVGVLGSCKILDDGDCPEPGTKETSECSKDAECGFGKYCEINVEECDTGGLGHDASDKYWTNKCKPIVTSGDSDICDAASGDACSVD